MRTKVFALAVLAFGLFSSSAHAQWYGVTGNYRGGLIPWSPGIERVAVKTAAEHCAAYNRVAYITGPNRGYGNYISFTCYFDRRYDPRKSGWFW